MAKTITKSASVEAQVQDVQNNQNQKPKFNIWDYTYKALVKGYVDAGEVDSFDCIVKNIDDRTFKVKDEETGEYVTVEQEGSRKVFGYLRKATGLEIENITEYYKDDKRYYQVKVKNFNMKAEVDGKFGKRRIFTKYYGDAKLA